ncbi:MAG: hypothetical protein ACOX1V_02750 [Candidatus Iainarchaeum sp.]
MKEMYFVEFWAKKCKEDMSFCLAQTTPFINSQILSANDFYLRLSKTRVGKKK